MQRAGAYFARSPNRSIPCTPSISRTPDLQQRANRKSSTTIDLTDDDDVAMEDRDIVDLTGGSQEVSRSLYVQRSY